MIQPERLQTQCLTRIGSWFFAAAKNVENEPHYIRLNLSIFSAGDKSCNPYRPEGVMFHKIFTQDLKRLLNPNLT